MVDMTGKFFLLEDLDAEYVQANMNASDYDPWQGKYVKNAYDATKGEKDETLDSHVVTKTEYPEEFTTVSVTITVTAEYTEGVGYTVDGCRIAVGREYELNFPGCAGKGVCVEFKAE